LVSLFIVKGFTVLNTLNLLFIFISFSRHYTRH